MTLIRNDGNGYGVISDMGKSYGLYEMKTIGADSTKSTDIISIMYEAEDSTYGKIIDFFYGATEENIRDSVDFIRRAINKFESENFAEDYLLYSEVIKTF